MSPSTLPRRDFLLLALASCGTPLFTSVASSGLEQQAEPGLRGGSQTALQYFAEAGESARKVGEAYARQINLDFTEESILKAANDVLELIAGSRGSNDALTALGNAVRRDFQEGRSVQVEGWVLSRTELELCLLMLLQSSP
jgi:hypothetical protein